MTETDIFTILLQAGVVFNYSDWKEFTKEQQEAFIVASTLVKEEKKVDLIEAILEAICPDEEVFEKIELENRMREAKKRYMGVTE